MQKIFVFGVSDNFSMFMYYESVGVLCVRARENKTINNARKTTVDSLQYV